MPPVQTKDMAATERALEEDNEAVIDSRAVETRVEEKEEFSIDDAAESLGFGAFHFLMLLFCGLGWVSALT